MTLRAGCVRGVVLLGGQFLPAGDAYSQTWTPTGAPAGQWIIACSAAGDVVIAADNYNDVLAVSTNSGANWRIVDKPASSTNWRGWRSGAVSADGTRLIAVCDADSGDLGFVYTSTNSGATWGQASAPHKHWTAVACSSDGKTVVVGPYRGYGDTLGYVYISTNLGATWTPQTSAGNDNWGSVACSADGTKLVLSDLYGAILTSTNSGVTWSANNTPYFQANALVASSADGSRLVTVGSSYTDPYGNVRPGLIYMSTNSGQLRRSWNALSAPSNTWSSIASSADMTKLVVAASADGFGLASFPYTSTDSGASWGAAAAPAATWISVASSADGGKLFGAVYQGGIYSSQSRPTVPLSIALSGGKVIISWLVPSVGLDLQQSTALGGTWAKVATAPVINPTNLQCQVIISPSLAGSSFYRLVSR